LARVPQVSETVGRFPIEVRAVSRSRLIASAVALLSGRQSGSATRRQGAQEVAGLEGMVPRAWLERHGAAANGLSNSVRDINPRLIRGVITFGELSRSPVDEPAPAV
jgi:hypothetical protein